MMKAMNEEFGVTTDKYWSLLASFDRECTAKEKKHTSLTDYKQHFYDWTRRHVEINGKEEDKNKGKGYGTNRQDNGATARRLSDHERVEQALQRSTDEYNRKVLMGLGEGY